MKSKTNWPFDYLYSDPHFFHKNVIPYCKRPFGTTPEGKPDVEAMNAELIKRYNQVVKPEDTVLWLGDCFFCGRIKAKEIMDQLNGRKILILGNHDDASLTRMMKLGFVWACNEMRIKLGGHTVRICHYPYKQKWYQKLFNKYDDRYENRRPPRIKGEILLHGHVHEKWKVRDNMINCGVDVWDLKPVHANEIVKLIHAIKKRS